MKDSCYLLYIDIDGVMHLARFGNSASSGLLG